MSDFDDDGRREPDPDELRDAYEERKRRLPHCACGYPDLPGHCPGRHACPMANYGEPEDG